MPIYEYKCSNAHTSVYLCHIANRDSPRVCAECRQDAHRIPSATRTTFRFADKKLKKPYADNG